MSKLFIEDCQSLYSKCFPEDWIEKKKWDSQENASSSFTSCIEDMQKFEKKFFVCLSKSVLSGEYIISEDRVRNVREYFQECAKKEHVCPRSEQNDDIPDIKRKVYEEYEDLDLNIEKMFFRYEILIQKFKEKVDGQEHNIILEAYRIKTKTVEPKLFSYFNNLIISTCIDEHRMRYDKERIREYLLMIQEINHELNKEPDENVKFVLNVFREKVKLLLRKLICFFNKKGEYTIDFNKHTLDEDELTVDYFLKDYLLNFEYIHEDKTIPDKYVDEIQSNCARKSARLSEFAILMKYYTCGHGTEEQVENLLADFNRYYKSLYRKSINKTFDKHALDTLKNYMYNCRLSFFIRTKEYTVDGLIQDIKEISSIQTETKIKNYYPYKKALEFLKEKIKTRLEKNDLENNKKVLLSWISIFNEYVERFEDNFRWCDTNNFYPIQLMYNECCVNVKDGDRFKLFVPSTFTLPQNFEKIREALNGFKSDSLFFGEMSEFIKYREDVNLLRKDFKQSERKIIEIGGLFITIITFLFGTIQIYSQKNVNANDLIMATLAFGCLLMVFSSSIYFITFQRDNEGKNCRFWFFVIVSIVYTVILIFYLISIHISSVSDCIRKLALCPGRIC